MKRDRIINALWAWLLAAAISFFGIACVVTGLRVPEIDLMKILLTLVLASLIAAAACCFRYACWAVLGTFALLCIGGWWKGNLSASLSRLAEYISTIYDGAYEWGIISWWEDDTRSGAEALGAVGCLVAIVVAWTVGGREKAWPAVFAGLLPVAACFVVTDSVPRTWCLCGVMTGLVLLMLTSLVRRADAGAGNRLLIITLVPTALLGILLFAVIPENGIDFHKEAVQAKLESWAEEIADRFSASGGLFEGGPGKGGSVAKKVNLGKLDSQTDAAEEAMCVTSTADGTLYLRGQAFDVYDGKSWSVSDWETGLPKGWAAVGGTMRGKVNIATRETRKLMYFPVYPSMAIESMDMTGGYIPNTEQKDRYAFYWCTPGQPAPQVGGEYRAHYLELPETTREYFAGRDHTQLDRLSLREKALFIGKYVRSIAQYSLTPQRMPKKEKDFARWFLEDAEEGYCVHFATAAAVMLRAEGIPARYVTGYLLQAKAGNTIVVTEKQAHAWVEFFDPDAGWSILDATPGQTLQPVFAADPEPTEPEPTETEPTEPEPTETIPPETEPTNPSDPPILIPEPSEPGPTDTEPTETGPVIPVPENPGNSGNPEPEAKMPAWLMPVLAAAGILAAVWLTLWGQYRIRLAVFRRKRQKGTTNRQALYLWKKCAKTADRMSMVPDEEVQAMAEKAKFSQHEIRTEELAVFDRYLDKLGTVRAERNWLWRLIFRWTWATET